jgi:hypothetical protein
MEGGQSATDFIFTLICVMKYSQWIGFAACILLVVACFLPWAWYPDLQKDFTGFFSEENRYGQPGKLILFFTGLSMLCFLIPRVWAKRFNLLFGALNLAFAIRCYYVFTACYLGICPEKKAGIFLVVIAPLIIMLAAVLPDMKLKRGGE